MKPQIRISDVWNELLPGRLLERLDETPFLSRCREGKASGAELEIFLVQQFHYSRHFTRYLCALLANMTSDADRLALTGNLFEEMGLDGLGGVPHSQIYREMLLALNLDPSQSPPFPETSALVATMFQLSSDNDPLVGLAALCLGAEAIVPHVYQQVLNGLLTAGFPESRLEFFPLHIAGDDEHALTMKRIIDRELAVAPGKLANLRRVAEQAIEARVEFFNAITATRAMNREQEVRYAV